MNSQVERWAEFRCGLRRDKTDSPIRLMVIAAHPDDETIGASLVLSRFPQTEVVYFTDGAPRDRKLWSPEARGSREDYAALRRREAENALAHAALRTNQITWLGAVDQEAIFRSAELIGKLADILEARQPDIVVTHPYEGGHPDHDTAALVAQMAIAGSQSTALLVEMTSYHSSAGACVTGEFLNPDANEIVCDLGAEDCARKRRMMDEHWSQRAVLKGFGIDRERFRPAPAYDFAKTPHEGRLWYECMEWPMTGAGWRLLASDAIREVQESDVTVGA
jgi:LmbE family N-acetylglucosaminyl deacetylase